MTRKALPVLAILLVAFVLRVHNLTDVPPGLTHDEADHGLDSIRLLEGRLLFYFPVGYGREPLYNYLASISMALVGKGLFGLRLANVLLGVLAVTAAYRWARTAFDRPTALLAAATMAVSFWPVSTSRQALRSSMMPFLITAAVLFFWRLYLRATDGGKPGPVVGASADAVSERRASSSQIRGDIWPAIAFGLFVAAGLYTYLAARVLWVMFPLFGVYLALFHRRCPRSLCLSALGGLLLGGLLFVPLFLHLRANPQLETRLDALLGPLEATTAGDLGPLLTNARETLLAFFWPGFGDHFLAYNLPGRPVFLPVTAALFGVGLFACLWHWRRPAQMFVLLWFAAGIIPSLITGPEAATTRNQGALPAAYIIPALGFIAAGRFFVGRGKRSKPTAMILAAMLWFFLITVATARDYFARWGESPDVRAAYQHTLVEALNYLKDLPPASSTVISTIYPNAVHDPAIGSVLLSGEIDGLRWVDARWGMIVPGGKTSRLIALSSTPVHPAFADMLQQRDRIALRPDDLDPTFTLYDLKAREPVAAGTEVNFGDALQLAGARWLTESSPPGGTAEMFTWWRVVDPERVGPEVPPAFKTEAVLFTHVLGREGEIIAQQDSLEAPSWAWQAGDVVYQIHPIPLPLDLGHGLYKTVVGVYDRASGDRLPVLDGAGDIVDDRTFVVPLQINDG